MAFRDYIRNEVSLSADMAGIHVHIPFCGWWSIVPVVIKHRVIQSPLNVLVISQPPLQPVHDIHLASASLAN